MSDATRRAQPVAIRDTPRPEDAAAIGRLVETTGFFRPDEVAIAVELIEERLARGDASGYRFVFADAPSGELAGYACFGPIGCTLGSFDLYWIAVDPAHQSCGLGRALLMAVEERIACEGGRCLYAETSSKPQYEPTRRFYRATGFIAEALVRDFYDEGDDKVIFAKRVAER